MFHNARSNPRKLPVVLQVRQMADRRKASERVVSLLGGWNVRHLTILAAIPLVSLAVYVGWQMTGEPADDSLMPLNMSQTSVIEPDPLTDSTMVMESGPAPSTTVETVSYDSPSTLNGPKLPGSPLSSYESDPSTAEHNTHQRSQRIQIQSVVPMPPAQTQQAERERTMMR